MTVEFACLKCHTDETRDWALAYAEGIHSFVKVVPPVVKVVPPVVKVGLVVVGILAVGLIMALSPYVRRVVRGLFGRGKDQK